MENAENKEAPQFGPAPNGDYLTPYQMTVVFNQNSTFESAVAFLSDRAQLIPLAGEIDYSAVAAACEHPSPEVLVFDSAFSREDLDKFFERGCQIIHVFSYGGVESSPFLKKENDVFSPIDPRIIPFDQTTLYDHLYLIKGLTPLYLLEYIACATLPRYKSIIDEKTVNCAAGRHLLNAINFAKNDLCVVLLQLCSSADGFDKINQLIIRGQSISEVGEHIASERLYRGTFFDLHYSKNEAKLEKTALTESAEGANSTESVKHNETTECETTECETTECETTECETTECETTECKENTEPLPAQGQTTNYTTYAVPGDDLVEEMINLAPCHPAVVKNNANFVMFYRAEPHNINNVVYPGWRIILFGINNAPNAYEVLRKYSPQFTKGDYGRASAWVTTRQSKPLLPFIYP